MPVCASMTSITGVSSMTGSDSPNALTAAISGVLTFWEAAAKAVSPSAETESSSVKPSSPFFLRLMGIQRRLAIRAATKASTSMSDTWMNLWFASISRETLKMNAKTMGVSEQRNTMKR